MMVSSRQTEEMEGGGILYKKRTSILDLIRSMNKGGVVPPTSNPQIPMRYQDLCRGGKMRKGCGGILKK